MQEFAQFT